MTSSSRRRRAGGGWLSGAKRRQPRKPTPAWQWFVGIPLMAVVGVAIVAYVYFAYFAPGSGRTARTVRAEVIDRVEVLRPDGQVDLNRSSLLLRVEGKDLRAAAQIPDWPSVQKGDTVEVHMGMAPDGSPQVLSWKRRPSP